MNSIQKSIVFLSFISTLFIIVVDNLFPGYTTVRIFKLLVIISLFLRASTIEKKYPEQNLLTLALFFAAAGDFIFVLSHTRPTLFSLVTPFGAAQFALAYLFLLNVYSKKGKFSFYHTVLFLLFIGIFFQLFGKYFLHIQGLLIYALFLFGLILCCMTWRSVCTLFEGYYTFHSAIYMALSGILIFLSDTFVGIAVFEPAFFNQFVPWMENVIWGTFILAWTTVLLLVAEDRLIK